MSYNFAARVLDFDEVFSDRDILDFSASSAAAGRFTGFPQAVADDYRNTIRDTSAALGQLTAGGSITGIVDARGDRDIFAISLTAGQTVTFNLVNSGGSGGLSDPLLRLQNSSGTVIASNDDFGGSRNSRITFTASTSGTYYLDAAGYSSSTGRYTLSASGTATAPTPTDDYRDSLTDTTAPFGTVAIGSSATGRIETTGDTDMFSVALTAGQTYSFNLAGSGSGAIANPALKLFNGSGTQVAANDDAGGTLNSAISFTASASGTYYLQAAGSTSAQTGAYQLSAASTTPTTPPPAAGAFDIVVRYSGDARYQTAFEQAAARWEQIIVGDIPDFNSSRFGLVDDLLIDASAIAIDGAGGVLGRAGPDQIRSGSMLPVHGIMEFDSADLAGMAANGTLVNVIIHEMGHVLGLGTLWDNLGLKSSNTQYVGANALREYRALSGNSTATFVPLENDGGPGTAGGHWEEDIFGTEVMTGFANGSLPISRMTIAALQDLGYQVNYGAADAYSLPRRALGLQAEDQQALHHVDEVFGII